MNPADEINLRTSASVPGPLVRTTYLNLQVAFEQMPFAFYELVQLARDPGHQLADGSDAALRKLSLLDNCNRIPDGVRQVILAAASGTDLDLHLLPFGEIVAS